MHRYALRDDQWDRIKDFLPGREGHVGGTAADNRLFVDAVIYRYRTGIPWRDLPERYGHWKTTHRRYRRWCESGVFQRVFEDVGARRRQRIHDDRRDHRARAPAQRRRSKKDGEDQAIGRSRGGLTHEDPRPRRCARQSRRAVADARAGADITQAEPLLDGSSPGR